MKIKEIVDSIVIHSFIGYITITSLSVTLEMVNKLVQVSWLASFAFYLIMSMAIGSIMNNRISPYNQYNSKHPTKIIGNIMFLLVLILLYNLDKNGIINLIR